MRAAGLALGLCACTGSGAVPSYVASSGGDPARGRAVIEARHCGACHDVPGVPGAHGRIGVPLGGLALRSTLAGELPNTPENLVRWIRAPRAIRPTVVMPNLGLDEVEARDAAAYLLTLR